jgi:hypothetical protein
MIRIIAALAFAAASTASHAQFIDGNRLLERMSDESTVKQMVALGYVLGVADSFAESEICIPQNVQASQLADIVRRWLQNNPDKRHVSAAAIVLVSLRSVWPCKPQQPQLNQGSKL